MREIRSVIYKGNGDDHRSPAIMLKKSKDQFVYGTDVEI